MVARRIEVRGAPVERVQAGSRPVGHPKVMAFTEQEVRQVRDSATRFIGSMTLWKFFIECLLGRKISDEDAREMLRLVGA